VPGPAAREYFALWIDEADPDRVLLFGGFTYLPKQFTPAWDAWELDLVAETWSELTTAAAPQQPGGRVAPVPGASATLYFGGVDAATNSTPYLLKRFDSAAEVLSWSDVNVEHALTSGAYTGAFVYDAPRNRYLVFGGVNSRNGLSTRVDVFTPSPAGEPGRWEQLVPATDDGPTGRMGFHYAYDAETQRFIVFSGDQQFSSWTPDLAQDTWALELGEDPVRWVRLAEASTPPLGRRNGAFALDPVGHRFFVWGGTADGASSFPGLHVLDLDRGAERWQEVTPLNPPPERCSAGAVYDAARHRILAGFGNGDDVYADLWALEL
jgi:hypothetical protein